MTDVVEKTCAIFVGTPSRSATNWFVAKKVADYMGHVIQLFVPPRGMVLEFGNLQAQVTSCLKPSIPRKVNLLCKNDEEKPVAAFKKEAAALSHTTSSSISVESGSDHGD